MAKSTGKSTPKKGSPAGSGSKTGKGGKGKGNGVATPPKRTLPGM